jgi:carbon-monoxide dehydrogenase medium subunit
MKSAAIPGGADPMSLWENYYIASSTDDALRALREAPGPARVVAGGTDLLLDIQQGRHAPVHTFVDVNEIPDLKKLEVRDGELYIGASVPHRVITTSGLVCENCQALATASGLIGGPQVRNTATIGGNVAHALPAADGTIALMALGADAQVAGTGGPRRVPMADLFKGPGESTLVPNEEILTGFFVPLRRPGQGSAFNRIMRPQGVAIAIINLAAWIHMQGGRVQDVRIAVGPSGPVPRRLAKAEDALRGKAPDDEAVAAAYAAALEDASLRTSRHRATKEYRRDMVGVLLEKTLREAVERAQ